MKVIDESRRKKKKKSELGWFYQLSPGNPEYNMNAFNHSMDVGSVPTSGSVGESLDEAIQKNIYEITYIDSNDNSTIAYIEAYSEKQAALVLRKETKVYKILNIDCIEDHSKDDGEQLSLFGEKKMKFKIRKNINESISNKWNYVVEPHKIDMDLYDIRFIDSGKRAHTRRFQSYDDALKFIKNNAKYNNWIAGSKADFNDNQLTNFGDKIKSAKVNEDTIKQNDKWVNKGKEGTHGKFKTKKEADAQRKAMFVSGYREELTEDKHFEHY